MPLIFDSHCHLDFPEFDADRDQVIRRARAAGVVGFVVPGTTCGGWKNLLKITSQYPELYPALGLHPWFMDEHTEDDLDQLRNLARRHHPIAIGEIGLDFQLPEHNTDAQVKLLKAQLHIAAELDLPVILHVRKAHETMLRALGEVKVPRGICHAFNGSLQQAERYMKLGFRFGFGGMLTHPNARRLHNLARELPLEHIVLETDAPSMSGARH
ncbi:MAG TPA: TatD family deoxyribonuclease, partial [Chromatiaceae bacterium]|nr:TatD family deoxyribonuclease [Chromatiaceae bacterium]